jgi:hypothetical protein
LELSARPEQVAPSRRNSTPDHVPTVDFSGWPTYRQFQTVEMAQLCANDQEAPYDVPLHPGAKCFYLEKG